MFQWKLQDEKNRIDAEMHQCKLGEIAYLILRLLTIAGASSAALLLTIAWRKTITRFIFLIETHLERLNFTRNIFYRHFLSAMCAINYFVWLARRRPMEIVSKTKKSNSIFFGDGRAQQHI